MQARAIERLSGQIIQLLDRFFLKKPLFRRFVTRLVAGATEEKVVLLAKEIQMHTVREHGYFRASKLSRTCSLFRDELPVLIHLAGLLQDVAAALQKAKVGRDRARPSPGKTAKFRRWSSRQASFHFQAGDL
jgi:hypothetical protein